MTTIAQKTCNGVDLDALQETVSAIQEKPELAQFHFRARNRYLEGGHNRSEVKSFYGAGQEDQNRQKPYVLDNDEPPVLLGKDAGPNPVEYVIQALLGCMTTTTAYHAAAQGIEIESIRSEVEGDLDLRGFLQLDPETPPGYRELRATLRIKTNGDPEKVKNLHRLSPVFDTLSRPIPIKVNVEFES